MSILEEPIFSLPALVLAAMVFCENGQASLITTFDFNDGNWSNTLTQSTGSPSDNLSSVSGGTILADKGGGTGGVRIQVSLTGSISTVGFENITLAFFGDADGDLEWDGSLENTVNSTDGLRITSSQGVTVDANGLDDTSSNEINFDNGATFPDAGTAGFSASDFSFAPSADDGAINDLTLILQVNANGETLEVSNVRIFGDPITAVIPEPSSALGILSLIGAAFLRRRRRAMA